MWANGLQCPTYPTWIEKEKNHNQTKNKLILNTDREVDISTYTHFYGKIYHDKLGFKCHNPLQHFSLCTYHYLSLRFNLWEWAFLSPNFPFAKL